MKNFFQRYKWVRVLYAVLLICIGVAITIVTFLLKNYVDLTLSITVASTLFVIGLAIFISTLFNERKEPFSSGLVYSALIITLGVILLMNTSLIRSFSLTLLSVFAIVLGAAIIFKGILSITYKLKWYLTAAYFIVASAFIAYGIITLIYTDVAFILTFAAGGIAITIYGIVELIIGIKEIIGR